MPKIYNISDLESRWVPVSEAIPPEGVALIIASKQCRVEVGRYDKKNGFRRRYCDTTIFEPTHWRMFPRDPNFEYTNNLIELYEREEN